MKLDSEPDFRTQENFFAPEITAPMVERLSTELEALSGYVGIYKDELKALIGEDNPLYITQSGKLTEQLALLVNIVALGQKNMLTEKRLMEWIEITTKIRLLIGQ